ncbi:MAG: ATP-binding protein [Caulobacteraceae bacterium]|nr:ATP-binding protein [Caulobacteraceae bacterium]
MTGRQKVKTVETPTIGRSALEERLSAILDHVADAIIVANDQGVIESINLAAARLFGWDEASLAGQRLDVLMSGRDQAEHAGYLSRYLETGRAGIVNVGPRTLQARRQDGVMIPIELSVGEAWIDGERKFIGACRDISQRIANEEALSQMVADLRASNEALERERRQSEAWAREAEAANLAKSRFLATMSHEIRTPLNGVIAIADVLASRVSAPEDRELVGIVRESGRTLLGLLNEVLDLAKIEAGALQLDPAPFALGELVTSQAVTWRQAASSKGLDIQVATAMLPALLGDEGRLRQVISNLISNAIKFTERGSVSIRCETLGIADNLAQVRLVVADTGLGFDSALAERVFEPFVQADSTNTRRHGGTGLGLAICRELVNLMGGDIRAESAPGVGTTVTLRLALPLAPTEAGRHAADDHRLTRLTAPQTRSGPLVLVADDHPLNRRIMGVLLDELGLEHEMVEDGAAAVKAAASGLYDLILMDVQMPVMDGLEATRTIRRLPGAAGKVCVIAVTADAMNDHAAACRDAGMNDFLPKPIQPMQLQALLIKHLSAARRIAS